MGTEETLDESIKLSAGAAGVSAELKNPTQRGVYVLLCAVIVGGISAAFYISSARAAAWHAEAMASQAKVEAALQKYEETQQAVIYILSLPQAQRESLNISKPKVIRDMQRRGADAP